MTPTQRAAAERLAEFESLPRKLLDIACRVRVNECLFHDDEFVDDASHTLKEALALLRELAAEPVQAPVAWMAESKSGTARFTNIGQSADELESLGWAIVPLYAAPQQRKPLSADQIRDAVNDHAFWATSKNFIFRIARAIERAHGITGEPT